MSIDLLKRVEEYIPYNEIEKQEKESFIQFIKTFKDKIWTRDNLIGHITVSAWITNKTRTKILVNHHNLYNSWTWLGGHSDNESNILKTIKKEIKEECGISNIKILSEEIFDISVLTCQRHKKNNIEISNHLHFNITILIEIDENETLKINKNENSELKWIKNHKILQYCTESHMQYIYQRLIEKTKKIN